MKKSILIAFLLITVLQASGGYKAGIGRIVITPDTPVWLSGYASRIKPSTEVLCDLWAKVLVLEDSKNYRFIMVSLDLIGLSHDLAENIIQKVTDKYGIKRSQLLLNASHTHSGPVIWPSLSMMFELKNEDIERMVKYNRQLTENILEAIDQAIMNLKQANLYVTHGFANIAVNRRQTSDTGVIIGVNREGPIDNDVPVIKVESTEGDLIAVLFGYACHNTTLNNYQINGDYAGFAQIEIEKENPGTTAMFISGCGADQNPDPRRTVEYAIQHGNTLANAVQRVLRGKSVMLRPRLRTARIEVTLNFSRTDPEILEDELLSGDRFSAGRAKFILEAMDKGYDIGRLTYPVQSVRFGKEFTIVALGGEVVVDYSLETKRRYSGRDLFVAGYSTEVQCYIPTSEILREGGYEPETSMIYYGLPGPFTGNVEEIITGAIDYVMKKTGTRPTRR